MRGEAGLKRFLRGVYLRLAHKVLVYSERGKRLGGASGYPADRIDVIYNSLDFDRSQKAVDVLKAGNCILPKPQSFLSIQSVHW